MDANALMNTLPEAVDAIRRTSVQSVIDPALLAYPLTLKRAAGCTSHCSRWYQIPLSLFVETVYPGV